ncbi:Protein disabled [Clarias magur]|uniref:Protein disabled n=1 Tax=Clarias magur TaxID=1594786 RepID=A0A8J4WSS2_CLAMG|nr:Protein disabled [Clarias magur]
METQTPEMSQGPEGGSTRGIVANGSGALSCPYQQAPAPRLNHCCQEIRPVERDTVSPSRHDSLARPCETDVSVTRHGVCVRISVCWCERDRRDSFY